MAAMFPVVMLVLNVASVAVLWFGGLRVDSGAMQIGSLTAFLTYLVQILMSVMMATFTLDHGAPGLGQRRPHRCGARARSLPSCRRSQGSRISTQRGRLELRNVQYVYPGARDPVLRDVTFEAHPGQTTAIIGSTGAGKTTLISLIPRLFDVTSGEVRVDGVDVRLLDPEVLWSRIGLVPQHAVSVLREPSPATCGTGSRTQPTKRCGPHWRSPRPRTS